MIDATTKNTIYDSFGTNTYKEYLRFIKLLLKNTDQICFTIKPCLDDLDEFKKSKWGHLSGSIIKQTCDHAIDMPEYLRSLLYFKNDYTMYDFFIHLKSISDFTEDENLGITMEDPIFIKNGEVICYTVTHEDLCDLKIELADQLREEDNSEL